MYIKLVKHYHEQDVVFEGSVLKLERLDEKGQVLMVTEGAASVARFLEDLEPLLRSLRTQLAWVNRDLEYHEEQIADVRDVDIS